MAAKLNVESSLYKDAVEQASSYNSRLVFERKQRSPFIDSQTGIAQISCQLWKSKLSRRAPAYPYQLYSYPARRWKKKPRKVPTPVKTDQEPRIDESTVPASNDDVPTNPTIPEKAENTEELPESPIEEVPEESDDNSENDSEDEDDDEDNDDDDDSLHGGRRQHRSMSKPFHKKPPSVTLNPKANPTELKVRNYTKEELAKMSYEERQKPYVCEICGKRYKNGPGLKYHYTHYNHDMDDNSNTSETMEVTPNNTSLPAMDMPVMLSEATVPIPTQFNIPSITKPEIPAEMVMVEKSVTPNDYCDFCLGNVSKNKKTLMSEELLSCTDCGRSGHPTCLQFTMKLTNNVKKYKWQCIECKSCTDCGTSDNDDQLLFCDDCDRGYHMYCLKPPLKTPPEGSWICKLCEEDNQYIQNNIQQSLA